MDVLDGHPVGCKVITNLKGTKTHLINKVSQYHTVFKRKSDEITILG